MKNKNCPNCRVSMEFKRKINNLNDIPMIISFWYCPECFREWHETNSEIIPLVSF